MKKFVFLITLIHLLVGANLSASKLESAVGILILEGHYQGKNVYIQSNYGTDGIGFCVYEVKVNGAVTTDELNSRTFEIDLASFGYKIGTSILIRIKYKKGCNIHILNPSVLLPKSTYEIEKIAISSKGLLTWSTKNEAGKLTFIVQQFRWNKWVTIGEVDGKGTSSLHKYRFQSSPHSGENKLRVKQTGTSGKPRYSKSAKYISKSPEISFEQDDEAKKIIFSGKTLFEMYDSVGNILKKGYTKKINITDLKKGLFYLNYDNKSVNIVLLD